MLMKQESGQRWRMKQDLRFAQLSPDGWSNTQGENAETRASEK